MQQMKNLSSSLLITTSSKQEISQIASDKKTDIQTHSRRVHDSVDSSKKKTRLNDHTNVSLFGMDLSHLQPTTQAIILTIIILFGFVLTGYVEEGFKFEFENFSYGWFMTAVELIIFTVFAMIERLFKSLSKITHLPQQREVLSESETESLINNGNACDNPALNKKSNGPKQEYLERTLSPNASKILSIIGIIFEKQMALKYHLIVAFAMMCSRALTNMALLLLNYPTQVIFKSMKLISVMLGSVCCLKKVYHKCEYIAAPLLVGSAVLFTFGDSHQLNFNILGIIVVLLSLVFDAIHANSQQYILQAKTERDTTMELLVYSNLIAGVLAFMVSLGMGELHEIYYVYIPQQPDNILSKLLLWFLVRVMCLYVGVSAFVVFTKRFGAVFAVTVTTVRKILTVLLSYVFYPGKKAFIPVQHGTGTMLFVLSLSLWGYGSVNKEPENRQRR